MLHQNPAPRSAPIPPPLPSLEQRLLHRKRRSTRHPRKLAVPPRRLQPKSLIRKRTPGLRGPHKAVRKELSAGGVVMRQENDSWHVALLQTEHKRGLVWVLPKGHVEPVHGENVAEAARREVQEEAGITDLSVKDQLGITRFKFQAEGTLVIKTVHYFLMITAQRHLEPQVEEGLLAAAWFPLEVAIQKLAYDTDQDIVRRAGERMGILPKSRQVGRTPTRRRQPRVHI